MVFGCLCENAYPNYIKLVISKLTLATLIQKPFLIATGSGEEINIVNNDVNIHEVHDSEDKLSTNYFP